MMNDDKLRMMDNDKLLRHMERCSERIGAANEIGELVKVLRTNKFKTPDEFISYLHTRIDTINKQREEDKKEIPNG